MCLHFMHGSDIYITCAYYAWIGYLTESKIKKLNFIVQVARVSHKDNLQSFVQKSESLEKQCLSKAIKSYCELRVLPYEETKTVVF